METDFKTGQKKAKQYATFSSKPQKFCSSKAVAGASGIHSDAIRNMSDEELSLAAGRMSAKANSANVTLNGAGDTDMLHMKRAGCNST